MNFSTVQKMPLEKKKKGAVTLHSQQISQVIETLNLPLTHVAWPWQWCPSISTASQAVPWSWEPNTTWTLCWDHRKLQSFECKLQSKFLQDMPKSLVHSNDEKDTSPCPRGNLASYNLWGEITATNHWKLQNFFLEEIWATKWSWFFCILCIANAHFSVEPINVHLLPDG